MIELLIAEYTNRRAYVGYCPEKQCLLRELKLLDFRGADRIKVQPVVDRLAEITFVPDYPGEDRDAPF